MMVKKRNFWYEKMKKCASHILLFCMLFNCIAIHMPVMEVKAASQAENLVSKAKSQIGIKERSSNSDDILYNDWFYGRRVNNNGVSAKYAWCAVFVSWCANQAGISTSVIPKTANTTDMKNRLVNLGGVIHLKGSGYSPKCGDIIFFGSNASQHVGIVEYSSQGKVYYIDGNNTQTNPHGVHYSSCSLTYGNLWGFVTPKYTSAGNDPTGVLDYDHVTGVPGGIHIEGWAFDKDNLSKALEIHVYVGGPAGSGRGAYTFKADGYRPDVNRVYTGVGDYHGFALEIQVPQRGTQEVYVYAINEGPGNTVLIGSTKVEIPEPNDPIGAVDHVRGVPGGIKLDGWAFDRDNLSKALEIHVYVGGPAGSGRGAYTFKANSYRPDINKAYTGVGDYHGFASEIQVSQKGTQEVYVYAINEGSGNNVLIGSKKVEIPDPNNPFGAVDHVTGVPGGIKLDGWAFDRDNLSKALEIHVYVGGPAGSGRGAYTFKANSYRPDLKKAYTGVGDYHGFASEIKVSQRGTQTVYVYAINEGSGNNVLIGSKEVTIPEEAKEHSFGIWKTLKEATCTTNGSRTRTCSICGKSETQVVAATGHKMGAWTVTKDATSTSDGEMTRGCSVCKVTETKTIPATGNDTDTDDKGTAPNNPSEGSTTGTKPTQPSTENVPGTNPAQPSTEDADGTDSAEEDEDGTDPSDEDGEEVEIPRPSDEETPTTETKPTQPSTGEPADTQPSVPEPLKKGSLIVDEATNSVYRVTASKAGGGEVEYRKPRNAGLTSIAIPNSIKKDGFTYKVTSISTKAFQNKKKLKKAVIGSDVKTIGSLAFSNCKNLQKVTIGNNVTSIGAKAFYKCVKLTGVTIPKKVDKIGKYAFGNCKKLKEITIKTTKLTLKKVGANAFQGVHKKVKVKVPKSKVDAYRKILKKRGIKF